MKSSSLIEARNASLESDRRAGYHVAAFLPIPETWIAWNRTQGGHALVKLYHGAASKPRFFYRFSSQEKAEKYLAEALQSLKDRIRSREAEKAERKQKIASKTAADFWAVGDVVYTSWGYDQTNVDFFQIVALKPRSVVVRQVMENCSDRGQPGGGKTQPRRNEFCGPEILCPINPDGRFSAGPCHGKEKPSFRHAVSKWDGRPKYTSSDR